MIYKEIYISSHITFLKIEDSKYIVYEKKNGKPYLLANKKQDNNKKYLYSDNKIDCFIYWCYHNNLLLEPIMNVIQNYINVFEEINYINISELLIMTVGENILIDYFTERGQAFVMSYLTITHGQFSYHYDFNKLYNHIDKLPRAIGNQKEFQMVFELLNIRYRQFNNDNFKPNKSEEKILKLL